MVSDGGNPFWDLAEAAVCSCSEPTNSATPPASSGRDPFHLTALKIGQQSQAIVRAMAITVTIVITVTANRALPREIMLRSVTHPLKDCNESTADVRGILG